MTPTTRRRIVDLSTRMNPFVRFILRSPVHWLLSPGLLLITVTGPKTGHRYTIPVGYHEMDDAIIVMVAEPRTKQWWRNYRVPGAVGLHHRGRTCSATATLVPFGTDEFRVRAEHCFGRSRIVERLFDLSYDRRSGLTDEQLAALEQRLAIVKIVLDRG